MGGFLSHLTPEENPGVLNATCGPIRGNIYKHGDVIIDGYLGIPYAKPPIGELRFQKPIPEEKWTEPKNCYEFGPVCVQTEGSEKITGPRDVAPEEAGCSTLNVFAPRAPTASGYPVMVFLHGGGYKHSGSADYCAYSLSGTLPLKNVIVVTINYRLGVFGFLTTGDNICRGNQGLWDQTLALKWVQNHIPSFGGDPKCVTVFGQSAGASSADLLGLSPHSRDLFHRTILCSGSAHCEFALRTSENQAKVFREFAEFHGFPPGGDSKSLFNWYKDQTPEVLSDIENFKKSVSGSLPFCPNFDEDFFPKPLAELQKEAPKKPMLLGVAELEGAMLAMINPKLHPADNGLKVLARSLYGKDIVSNPEDVEKDFYDFYTEGVNKSDEMAMKKRLAEAVSDVYFNAGVLKTAKSHVECGNDVFLYTFAHSNSDGFGMWSRYMPFKSACHCTELRYLLGEGIYSKFEPNEQDLKIMETTTTLFSNFAKYGNPNGNGPEKWEKYNLEYPEKNFQISNPNCEKKNDFFDGRTKFLEDLDEKTDKYRKLFYGKSE